MVVVVVVGGVVVVVVAVSSRHSCSGSRSGTRCSRGGGRGGRRRRHVILRTHALTSHTRNAIGGCGAEPCMDFHAVASESLTSTLHGSMMHVRLIDCSAPAVLLSLAFPFCCHLLFQNHKLVAPASSRTFAVPDALGNGSTAVHVHHM